jgi:SAM-dependent methyltransferase
MGPQDDRWMQRWLPLLREAAGARAVLELGCDTGGDTAWLLQQGLQVVAGDIALPALRQCALAAPRAQLLQLDLRQPLPFAGAAFGAVVASLCLHYFDWATTERAVAEIRRCLAPGGLLLCRLNSINDTLHGAGQGEEIEPHFWRVHGTYSECKRFFDRADVDRLFAAGWRVLNLEELANRRYAQPKVAWELVLRAAVDQPGGF